MLSSKHSSGSNCKFGRGFVRKIKKNVMSFVKIGPIPTNQRFLKSSLSENCFKSGLRKIKQEMRILIFAVFGKGEEMQAGSLACTYKCVRTFHIEN